DSGVPVPRTGTADTGHRRIRAAPAAIGWPTQYMKRIWRKVTESLVRRSWLQAFGGHVHAGRVTCPGRWLRARLRPLPRLGLVEIEEPQQVLALRQNGIRCQLSFQGIDAQLQAAPHAGMEAGGYLGTVRSRHKNLDPDHTAGRLTSRAFCHLSRAASS